MLNKLGRGTQRVLAQFGYSLLKAASYNYFTFIVFGLIMVIPMFIAHGVAGVYESYFERKELSRKTFNQIKSRYK